ncbi:enoyl-CoA hydratase/isomerase family protein [Chelatococcus sp. GCM10030263]|uniref:enoyl-CoA hydratase/isomerase family protein n=1 Tax=Chelatococcus sp. GCM10030263 TaxID=3273387 RepID=UPI00360D4399
MPRPEALPGLPGPQAVDEPVLVWRVGALARIRLNRPKALNSLTLPMVRIIAAALDAIEADPSLAAVLVDGAGERGFCAGGDIRAVHDSGRAGDGIAEAFWRVEYEVNDRIAAFGKPYVALMDGITMGGGVGLSAHSSNRVVTERTRLAMPETGIGFIPDVGGTWLLARAPGETGSYLGLSGQSIGAADAIFAGFADVLVPSEALGVLAEALEALPAGATAADVNAVIGRFAKPAGPAPLQANQAVIDRTFSFDEVPAILAALRADGSDFALEAAEIIGQRSPTSVVVTLALLRLARTAPSLRACLDREYVAACQTLRGHDFYEGVRAAVIDKDRQPRWQPATIAEVTPAIVEAHLAD